MSTLKSRLEKIEAALKNEKANITLLTQAGELANQLGNYKKAIKYYKQILKLNPHLPQIYCKIASLLVNQNQISSAKKSLKIAIKLDNNYLLPYLDLANIFESQNQPEKSEKYYQSALARFPDHQDLKNSYALFLKRMNLLNRSEKLFKELIKRNPKKAKYYGNYANLLMMQLKIKKAIKNYKKALKLKPDFYDAKFSRGLAYLLTKNYKKGWKDYEIRWKLAQFNMPKKIKPIWNGEQLKARKLLVWAEQGFGDTIQMYRFLKILKQNNVYTIFECQKELISLFRKNQLADEINSPGTTNPQDYDFHLPMMSLPYVLKITSDNIPLKDKYLTVNKKRISTVNGKLNIGLVWAGNSQYTNDRNRSIPPKLFKLLAEDNQFQIYSLQLKEQGSQKISSSVIDLAPKISTFFDTAEIINSLDLVISVDTAVIHLAGAMGKSAKLLVPYYPDWRWGLKTNQSFWYDSITIYRQKTPGDWETTISELYNDLKLL